MRCPVHRIALISGNGNKRGTLGCPKCGYTSKSTDLTGKMIDKNYILNMRKHTKEKLHELQKG